MFLHTNGLSMIKNTTFKYFIKMLMIFWFLLKAENSYLNLVQYKKNTTFIYFIKILMFFYILKAEKSYSNLYKYQKRITLLAYLIVENKVAPSLAIVCGNVGGISTTWLLLL